MATIKWRGKNNATAQLNWAENGQRHRISLGKITPEQAESLRLEKELDLINGASSALNVPGFEVFALEYLKWHKFEYPASHNRIYQITHDHLIPHYKNTPLDEIAPLNLETYKHQRATGQAKTETINKELRTFNAILNKAVEWQAIYTNPIQKLPTLKNNDSKPPRYYTRQELDAIYQAAPYNWHIWRFLANTGLRRGELLNLEWGQVTDDAILVISTETARTKSGKWRPVPLAPGATVALERFKADNPQMKGRVLQIKRLISKKKGFVLQPTTPASISRAFSKVLARSGIPQPHGSLHSLRHTFCSHLVMDGVDLTTVQKLAGHSTIKVTEQYAHLAPDHLKQSAQRLNL